MEMTDSLTSSAGTRPEFEKINDVIRAEMERLQVPGVAVGIYYKGQEYTAGFGVTNVDHPQPVEPDTLFQIGSTTKTFTATAVMRLVEQGKLDLTAPIVNYLPDLKLSSDEITSKVTLRDLFAHTSGWVGDVFDDFGPGDDAVAKYVAKMNGLEQLTPLGKIWSYNNAGFTLAGRVIEAVTGKTYEAAVKELVLEPLGMNNSFFFANEVITYSFAVGHESLPGQKPRVLRPWALPRSVNPAGALISTVKDQLKYARLHMGDGKAEDGSQFLKSETITLMQQPVAKAGSIADEVGVSWLIRHFGDKKTVGHGGTTNGQLSAFQMVPSEGFAITVFTNSTSGGALHGYIVKWALENILGWEIPGNEHINLSSEELAAFAGTYSGYGSTLDIVLEDNGLVLKSTPKDIPALGKHAPPPPTKLAIINGDRVVALDEPYKGAIGEFIREDDGQISWFRFGGRIARAQKSSAV
jgi:CubicO group peptidase (beta-lactamase class C family)